MPALISSMVRSTTTAKMEIPYHHNQQYIGKTVKWSGTDQQDRFVSHLTNLESRNRLEELGWLDTDAITYHYNSHGFRDDEFNQRPCGLAFGCSFTEGVGVDYSSTWPSQLSKLVGIHVWNLGVGGCAMDTVFRLTDYWIDQFDPEFVAVCTPASIRFELCLEETVDVKTVHNVKDEQFIKNWMLHNANSHYNYRKNLLAVQYLCAVKDIPLVVVTAGPNSDLVSDRKARDLDHPGRDALKKLADLAYRRLQECHK